MQEEKWIILTPNEIQEIYKFCAVHNSQNVIIFDTPCGGIGNLLHIATQNEWHEDKNCNKKDITDYDSW